MMPVEDQSTPVTRESERRTRGQRQVNLIWEGTQAIIALACTITTLAVAGAIAYFRPNDASALTLLQSGFFLIVGFYFGRTNHERTGGVGDRR